MNKCGLPPQVGNGAKYYIPFLIQAFVIGCVDLYALISGYVGLNSGFKFKSVLKLYLTVAFYSAGITILFAIFRPEEVNVQNIFESFLPFIFNYYWYYTAYFCMYFFTPFINKLINNLTDSEAWKLLALIFTFFTIIPTVFNVDIYSEGLGYSLIWLTSLYIVGACLKKLNLAEKFKKSQCLFLYFGLTILSFIFLFATKKLFNVGDNRFIQYTSPLTALACCALLLFFVNLEIKSKRAQKLIKIFSASAFSVYLIHVHPLVWRTDILWRIVGPAAFLDKPLIIPGVLLCAVCVYLACTFIDFGRALLFKGIASIFPKKKMC